MPNEINQKLGFDASGAITSLRDLTQVLNNANQAMTNFGNSSRKFAEKATPMMAILDRMGNSAAKISAALDRLGISAAKASAGVNQLGKPQGFAANMQYMDALVKKLQQAKQLQQNPPPPPPPPPVDKVKAFGAAWSQVGSIVKGMLLHQAIGLITRAFTGATEEARKFGMAINEIQTLAGPLRMTNADLSREVINLSNALGKSAGDVAQGLYQVLSNQVVDAADAFRFLAEAQKLAIATNSTTEESVDALSSVINSYNLGIEDTERISGQLFQIVNLGRVRLDEIADRIGRITPMASQMGMSFAEVGAAIATMTVQGVKADTAITQLRAVMSKMQKPTDELKKVFRSWGVEDGPAALKAFGGLAGVLKKLSQETGGSSTEMAEFFNVVRAMTGVMSLGTDEGKRFEEAIVSIENSSTAATTAFQKFLNTDAYSYTQQVNELKNTFLQLGQAILPLALTGAKLFNTMFGGVGDGMRVLYAAFNETEGMRMVFSQRDKQLAKEREAREKAFTKFDEREWKQREQQVFESVAKMGADFNTFVTQMETGQAASVAVFKSLMDDMSGNYKDALSKLTDYSKGARDRIKATTQEINGVMNEIQDFNFDVALDRAGSSFQKLNMLAQRASGQMNDAIMQAASAGSDPERFKQALETLKRSTSTARKMFAEAGNDRAAQDRAARLVNTTLLKQIELQDAFNKKTAEGAPVADAAAQSLTKKGEQLEKLLGAYEKSLKDIQKAETPAQEELARKTRDALKKQIQELDFGPEADIMRKLGMDPSSLDRLKFQLRDTFNLKEIEWDGAEASLQATLDAAKLTAKVRLSPDIQQIDFEGAGKAFGIDPKAFDNPAAFDQKVGERAKELLKEQNTQTNDLTSSTELLTEQTNRYGVAWKNISSNLREVRETGREAAKAAATTFGGFNGTAFDQTKFNAQLKQLDAVELSIREAVERVDTLFTNVSSGTPLTLEQLKTLSDEFDKVNSSKASAETKLAFGELTKSLQLANDELVKQQTAQENLTKNSAAFKAAGELVGQIEQAGQKLIEMKNQVDATNNSINNGATGFQGQRDAAGETNNNVRFLNESAGNLSVTISNATQKFKEMETAARNAAVAGAAAAKYAYAGGQASFLAAGGRGKDTIPTMLSQGEFVVNSRSAGKFFSELNAINGGSRPAYREQGGSVTTVGDVNVTVKGGDTAQATVREIGQALRREIQRGNIKLK